MQLGTDPKESRLNLDKKQFENDQDCVKFLADETAKTKLASAKKLSAVSAKVILWM